jgi:hypothetical protein
MNSTAMMRTFTVAISSLKISPWMIRTTALSLLLSTTVSAEPVEHHPISVRLESVASEESVVGTLLS